MILLLVLIGTFSFGFYLSRELRVELAGELLMIVAGILLLISLIILPINRQSCFADIAKIKAFQETVSASRMENLSEIERAAILSKIAEWNEWIAETKYYNNTIWDIFIPDEAANLQPIK